MELKYHEWTLNNLALHDYAGITGIIFILKQHSLIGCLKCLQSKSIFIFSINKKNHTIL